MANRKIEGILIVSAAALLAWALWRAGHRLEPATRAWTSFAMVGLVILSAVNILARSRAFALAGVAVCVLFVGLIVLAALLGAESGAANRLAAIGRAVLFFVLIGVASLLQARSPRPALGSSE